MISFLHYSCKVLGSEQNDTLSELEIINSDLSNIIDSLISFEEGQDYFDSSLSFFIDIQNADSIMVLQIGSCSPKILKRGNELGFTLYKSKFIIVRGSEVDKSIFRITERKQVYSFYVSSEEYDQESGEVLIDIYEDDMYTNWVYKFSNGHFLKLF